MSGVKTSTSTLLQNVNSKRNSGDLIMCSGKEIESETDHQMGLKIRGFLTQG